MTTRYSPAALLCSGGDVRQPVVDVPLPPMASEHRTLAVPQPPPSHANFRHNVPGYVLTFHCFVWLVPAFYGDVADCHNA